MSKKEVWAVWIGVLGCIVTFAVPPCRNAGTSQYFEGFRFLFGSDIRYGYAIDLSILFVEWALIGMIVTTAIITGRHAKVTSHNI